MLYPTTTYVQHASLLAMLAFRADGACNNELDAVTEGVRVVVRGVATGNVYVRIGGAQLPLRPADCQRLHQQLLVLLHEAERRQARAIRVAAWRATA